MTKSRYIKATAGLLVLLGLIAFGLRKYPESPFSKTQVKALEFLAKQDVADLNKYDWTSAGTIVCCVERNGRFDWFELNVTTGNRRHLPFLNDVTNNRSIEPQNIKVAPNGRMIAWVEPQSNKTGNSADILHVWSLDGTKIRQVQTGIGVSTATWDESSTRILLEQAYLYNPSQLFETHPLLVQWLSLKEPSRIHKVRFPVDPLAEPLHGMRNYVSNSDASTTVWDSSTNTLFKTGPLVVGPVPMDGCLERYNLAVDNTALAEVSIATPASGQLVSTRASANGKLIACAAICSDLSILDRWHLARNPMGARLRNKKHLQIWVVDNKGVTRSGTFGLPLNASGNAQGNSEIDRPIDLQWLPDQKHVSFLLFNRLWVTPSLVD